MELDLEDYVEEVKFQLTLFDDMEEDEILEFERRLRQWLDRGNRHPHIRFRKKEDIAVILRSEEDMEKHAAAWRRAVKQGKTEDFFESFSF